MEVYCLQTSKSDGVPDKSYVAHFVELLMFFKPREQRIDVVVIHVMEDGTVPEQNTSNCLDNIADTPRFSRVTSRPKTNLTNHEGTITTMR